MGVPVKKKERWVMGSSSIAQYSITLIKSVWAHPFSDKD